METRGTPDEEAWPGVDVPTGDGIPYTMREITTYKCRAGNESCIIPKLLEKAEYASRVGELGDDANMRF